MAGVAAFRDIEPGEEITVSCMSRPLSGPQLVSQLSPNHPFQISHSPIHTRSEQRSCRTIGVLPAPAAFVNRLLRSSRHLTSGANYS